MTARKDSPADTVVWIIRDAGGVTWECFIAGGTRTCHRDIDHYTARISALDGSNTPYWVMPGTGDPAAYGYDITPYGIWYGTSWIYENQDPKIPDDKKARDTPARAVQAGNGQIYNPTYGLEALGRKLDALAAKLTPPA